MSLSKLTIDEIIQRIEQFNDRKVTLSHIVKDIKDHVARLTLEMHLRSYEQSLEELNKELAQRRKIGRPLRPV
jgi:DNA repair exonuclease SbcCD ATPase subunit